MPDAEDVADALRTLGFDVLLRKDLTRLQLNTAVADFQTAAADAQVGFFYYAGHGVQVDGENYLIPIDAAIDDVEDVDAQAVAANGVIRAMEVGNRLLNVFVLDACRNNPWANHWKNTVPSRSFSPRGLRRMAPRSSFVLSFSTAPGEIADDSGVFASQLVESLMTPCLNVLHGFSQVATRVAQHTARRQRPWVEFGPGEAATSVFLAGCDERVVPRLVEAPRDRLVSRRGIELAWIPTGPFLMGSSGAESGRRSDEIRRSVHVDGLYVMIHEVSQGLWSQVMGHNPMAERTWTTSGTKHHLCGEVTEASLVDETFPVACVSWLDAARFANRLSELEGMEPVYEINEDQVTWLPGPKNGYRLLTEAEWERSARGGYASKAYASSDQQRDVCASANVWDQAGQRQWPADERSAFDCDDGSAGPTAVGAFAGNAYGLVHMTGNASEWVWDRYGSYGPEATDNPRGPDQGTHRVLRGGSWLNGPDHARISARSAYPPHHRDPYVGIRLGRAP